MLINPDKRYCYRICHIDNLRHLLNVGMCSKYHPLADPNFVSIGNIEIINARDTTDVQIAGYGKVGEYVPFYFTPRSIMLYNIVTGHRAPKVPKVPRENILVIRCLIEQLAKCGRYFFTDGQANVSNGTNHFHDLKDLDKIDWAIIQTSSFSKSTDDLDRARRYQAEFLVHDHVPVSAVESIVVYNKIAQARVEAQLKELQKDLSVQIIRNYFF